MRRTKFQIACMITLLPRIHLFLEKHSSKLVHLLHWKKTLLEVDYLRFLIDVKYLRIWIVETYFSFLILKIPLDETSSSSKELFDEVSRDSSSFRIILSSFKSLINSFYFSMIYSFLDFS